MSKFKLKVHRSEVCFVDYRPKACGVTLFDAEQGSVRVSLYGFRSADHLDQRQLKLADLLLLLFFRVLEY
jgi:uncharacterized protein YecT (DUF1311 family)